MYVEISGRQSGKTTRLADHASDTLINNINDRDFKIAVVGHNDVSSKRIHGVIIEKFLHKIYNMGFEGYRNICDTLEIQFPMCYNIIDRIGKKIIVKTDMSRQRGGGLYINKFYVDEFAFNMGELTINTDTYYCTTPTPNGNQEFTVRLLRFCLDRGVDIMSYDMSESLRHEFEYTTQYVRVFDNWCIEHHIHPRQQRLNNDLVSKDIMRHRF